MRRMGRWALGMALALGLTGCELAPSLVLGMHYKHAPAAYQDPADSPSYQQPVNPQPAPTRAPRLPGDPTHP